jgi:hypothetical protein
MLMPYGCHAPTRTAHRWHRHRGPGQVKSLSTHFNTTRQIHVARALVNENERGSVRKVRSTLLKNCTGS